MAESAIVTRRKLGPTVKHYDKTVIEILQISYRQASVVCLWDPATDRQWCEHTFTSVDVVVAYLENKHIDELFCPRCEECYRDKFLYIMQEHVTEEVRGIVKMSKHKDPKFNEELGANVYRWMAKLIPKDQEGKFQWKMVKHLQFLKEYARAVFAWKIDEAKTQLNLLKVNGDDLKDYFKEVHGIDIRDYWKIHLECTAEYVKQLHLQGSDSAAFLGAVQKCKEMGKAFGQYLDTQM